MEEKEKDKDGVSNMKKDEKESKLTTLHSSKKESYLQK